jgi:hypothetical protein
VVTVNESILLIENAGLAWWGGLLLISFAASTLLLFDRPAVSRSASIPKLEPLHAHQYEAEHEEDRKAA